MRFLLLIILCVSCGKKEETKIDGMKMGMAYKILIKEKISKETLGLIKEITNDTFKQIDDTLNGWNDTSEISKLNASSSIEKIEISPLLLDAIKTADSIYHLSDGKYDPSLGRVIHLWKMALRIGKTPSNEEIERFKESTGWDKLIIYNDGIQKMHPDLSIDLDGMTKGYFCDLVTKKLKELGLKYFLVEWAGEIKVSGGPFKVLADGKVLSLTDIAIATSGPTFQIYSIDNTIYSHFIDPKSLRFIEINNTTLSNSVTHASCAIADGLATASILK